MTKTEVASPARENTIGLVLAGGKATRMGGVNKGLVPFRGEPMAGRVIRTLSGQVSSVWVSANRDGQAFMRLGAEKVLPDALEGFPGPLAALDSLNECLKTEKARGVEWVLTVPCDVPLVPKTLLKVFVEAFDGRPAYTVETGGFDQNTISLIHVSALSAVRPFLAAGDRKLGLWFERLGRGHVHWMGAESAFANVNSPEELRQLEFEECERWNDD